MSMILADVPPISMVLRCLRRTVAVSSYKPCCDTWRNTNNA